MNFNLLFESTVHNSAMPINVLSGVEVFAQVFLINWLLNLCHIFVVTRYLPLQDRKTKIFDVKFRHLSTVCQSMKFPASRKIVMTIAMVMETKSQTSNLKEWKRCCVRCDRNTWPSSIPTPHKLILSIPIFITVFESISARPCVGWCSKRRKNTLPKVWGHCVTFLSDKKSRACPLISNKAKKWTYLCHVWKLSVSPIIALY